MSPNPAKLGILAGGGELPRLLIEGCREAGRDVFVIAFKGQCDAQTTLGVDHEWVRLGGAGLAIRHLRTQGVEELVMAGRINKPSMAQLTPDAWALKFLAMGILRKGDNALLSTIVQTLETQEGFRLVGAHEVLPELLAPEGVLGSLRPSVSDEKLIRSAVQAALNLGERDLGQAAVVGCDGSVVALEDRAGTDAMLKHLISLQTGTGAVLAKMSKPGQERRVDLPTMGPVTVHHAVQAGLRGIVIEAKSSLILNMREVIEISDKNNIFLVGVRP